MQEIVLKTASYDSVIYCGEGAFESVAPTLGNNIFIITDSNVFALYRPLIEKTFGGAPVYVFKAGERSKSAATLFSAFDKMIECGVTRSTTVIALGGGVVGDVAGLAASLYMRGVKVVQIPTTLLAQVDSSVGGKTAIDYRGVKNAIGSFYQPCKVIVDPAFLKTLPKRELRCGLGEIIKYGGIDGGIYQTLSDNSDRLFDFAFMEGVTADCIRHKAKVVAEDERDTLGARKTLNLGHTTGHAFELYYKRRSHGEFVLIGMFYELYIAVKKGVCGGEYADSLRKLIRRVIKTVPAFDDAAKAALVAKYDKKNKAQSQISVIAPKRVGESAEIILSVEEYASLVGECAEKIKEGL